MTCHSIPDASKPLQPIKLDPNLYDKYTGVYQLEDGLRVTVRAEEQQLLLSIFDQQTCRLLPISETRFFIATDQEAQIEFRAGMDGNVTELVIFQGGERKAVRI